MLTTHILLDWQSHNYIEVVHLIFFIVVCKFPLLNCLSIFTGEEPQEFQVYANSINRGGVDGSKQRLQRESKPSCESLNNLSQFDYNGSSGTKNAFDNREKRRVIGLELILIFILKVFQRLKTFFF